MTSFIKAMRAVRSPSRKPAAPCASLQRSSEEGERANMLVLGTIIWLVAALALGVIVNATSLYVQKRELVAKVDAVALEAASKIDEKEYYRSSGSAEGEAPEEASRELPDRAVDSQESSRHRAESAGRNKSAGRNYRGGFYGRDGRAVELHARQLAPEGTRVSHPTGIRGGSAVVTLEKQARLPLAFDFLGVKSVRIEATSSAKLRAIEPP